MSAETGKMKKTKPIARHTVTFEKIDGTGSHVIRLSEFSDGSVYLDGAEELIFDGGENSLKDAFDYLEQRGYKKKT